MVPLLKNRIANSGFGTFRLLRVAAIFVLGAWLNACTLSSGSTVAPIVKIDNGELRGVTIDTVHAFKGVPYAQPPINDLRWRSPQPAQPWEGVLDAREYSPHCAQLDNELLWFELDSYSEDCLKLNVWTPSLDALDSLPVMVWIHGGGYVNGSGNIARLNSPGFAKRGVVLVTVNYRLSAFGFMTHPALAASNPNEPNGNYALQDLVSSLQWVKNNIEHFGGDPNNVTIFGESAGAGLVNTLLVMPDAQGLFHKAISQSASVGLAPEPYPDRRAGFQPPSNKGGEAFARKAKIENYKAATPEVAEALRSLTTDEVLAAIDFRDRFTPVVDGEVLPDHVGALLAEGKQHAVPYMTGGVSWEASLGRSVGGPFSPENLSRIISDDVKAELYPDMSGAELEDAVFGDLVVLAASNYVARHMQKTGEGVYRFYISYVADARRATQPGVAHADDIAFVLGTLDAETDLTTISARDIATSNLLQSYWVQFATTGNPNGPDLPVWPELTADSAPVLEIGDEVKIQEQFFAKRLDYHTDRSEKLLEKARANP